VNNEVMWSDNPSERIIIRIFILGFLYFLHWLVPESVKIIIAVPLALCLLLFSLEFIGGFSKSLFGKNNDPEDNVGWGIWIIIIAGILLFFFYD
jgi:hypothetical protein